MVAAEVATITPVSATERVFRCRKCNGVIGRQVTHGDLLGGVSITLVGRHGSIQQWLTYGTLIYPCQHYQENRKCGHLNELVACDEE